ncbi:MAG: hypothetical protein AAGB22_02495 [Bacteroidota bacterium]
MKKHLSTLAIVLVLLGTTATSYAQFGTPFSVVIVNQTEFTQAVNVELEDYRAYGANGAPLQAQTCNNPPIVLVPTTVQPYSTTTINTTVNPAGLIGAGYLKACAANCGAASTCAEEYGPLCNGASVIMGACGNIQFYVGAYVPPGWVNASSGTLTVYIN